MSTEPGMRPMPRLPAWLGDTVWMSAVLLTIFVPFSVAEYRPETPFQVALIVAAAVVLPFRRRWPLAVLAVELVLYGLGAWSGMMSPGIVIAIPVAVFSVALTSSRIRSAIIAGVAVVAVVLLSLLTSVPNVFAPQVVQFALTVGFGFAFGDGVRSRRAYIAAIVERADRAERTRDEEAQRRVAEERLRIARDLHDAVAHQITVISLNAGVASSALETRPEKAREALGAIRTAARTVLGEIGDLLEYLRSDGDGVPDSTPQLGLAQLAALVERFEEAGLHVTTRVEGDLDEVTGAADRVAYQVVQEALTNAHKHGVDGAAHVHLAADGAHLRIDVTNPVAWVGGERDGVPSTGHGLIGMRERVASVRGTVSAGESPLGYRVAVELPLGEEHA
ncbi:sensor histidine kinase [Homoserinibacter sp. GY 40078]|uniref:sensor histidine kinase n=1 Tax=Homoserinibacter sp. GY 40078 TaxID=2603275 RepID=UPI001650835D|nr:histidine kinase [Homoserinibacter sp. GY 40078]